jgi:hypothetical protein
MLDDPQPPGHRDLPGFTISEYTTLIGDLLRNGYVSRPVEEIAEPNDGQALYLRHDVDVHITGIDRIGRIEADLGAVATYYVPLTLPFNPFFPENAAILRELVAMGHRLGLHYDLATYPDGETAARERLDREAVALGEITGVMPRTVCMHNPSLNGDDRFRDVDAYVNPHDPRYADGLLYVSDSCRAWRDEELLRCLGQNPPPRLLLNTHPELWLGTVDDGRESFLEGTLLENALEQPRTYVLETVRSAWRGHSGPASERARIEARCA